MCIRWSKRSHRNCSVRHIHSFIYSKSHLKITRHQSRMELFTHLFYKFTVVGRTCILQSSFFLCVISNVCCISSVTSGANWQWTLGVVGNIIQLWIFHEDRATSETHSTVILTRWVTECLDALLSAPGSAPQHQQHDANSSDSRCQCQPTLTGIATRGTVADESVPVLKSSWHTGAI